MLISAFCLHPCGADLWSVCAAVRRSSSLSEFQAAFGRWRMGRDCLRFAPAVSLRSARTAFSSLWRLQVRLRRNGGWGGIRTLGALLHTRFPSVRIRPLCHPSLRIRIKHQGRTGRKTAAARWPPARRAMRLGGASGPHRSLEISASVQRRVLPQKSARSRRVEAAAVAARAMKRMSMNVFTPASRTRGVGHRLGEAGKIREG